MVEVDGLMDYITYYDLNEGAHLRHPLLYVYDYLIRYQTSGPNSQRRASVAPTNSTSG